MIELLVVIAIIAILAAILFPVFAAARTKAIATSCLSGVKQLAYGQQMYLDDWTSFPMMQGWVVYDPKVFPNQPGWYPAYFRYIKSKDIVKCPAAKHLDWRPPYTMHVDYILSAVIVSQPGAKISLRKVHSPANTITFYDFGYQIDDLDPTDEWGDWNSVDGGKGSMWWNRYPDSPQWFPQPNGVHQGGYNVAAADCHAKFINKWNPAVLHRAWWTD